jgi:hypothetical protein
MTVQNHIEVLKRRHHDLDDDIRRLGSEPSADSLELRDMKKRKLGLKDEIDKLSRGN